MEQWWKRNNDLVDGDLVWGGYTKNEIEDFTGRIPLLLDSCVVDKKVNLEIDIFNRISEQASGFIRGIKNDKKSSRWQMYATTT